MVFEKTQGKSWQIEFLAYNQRRNFSKDWRLCSIIKGSTSKKKLLNVIIMNNKRNFTEHISKLHRKESQKLHNLVRISSYISTNELRFFMNAFLSSQSGCCALVWMFHNRSLNKGPSIKYVRSNLVIFGHPLPLYTLLHNRMMS